MVSYVRIFAIYSGVTLISRFSCMPANRSSIDKPGRRRVIRNREHTERLEAV